MVVGIRAGWLDAAVEVQTRGGLLRIEWAGGFEPGLDDRPATRVLMERSTCEPDPVNPADALQASPKATSPTTWPTPGFFERHAALLATVQLTHLHGHRAISLQERQAEMLREKIKGLEQRLMEMIRNGQENVAIADRLHRWTLKLMRGAARRHSGRAAGLLQHEFAIPQAGLRLWGVAEGHAELPWAQAVSADVQSFAGSLAHPYCGVNSGFEAARWLGLADSGGTATSLALVPLRRGTETLWPLGAGLAGPDALRLRWARVPDPHRRLAAAARLLPRRMTGAADPSFRTT